MPSVGDETAIALFRAGNAADVASLAHYLIALSGVRPTGGFRLLG
jgi:hypothetical protein